MVCGFILVLLVLLGLDRCCLHLFVVVDGDEKVSDSACWFHSALSGGARGAVLFRCAARKILRQYFNSAQLQIDTIGG